MITYRLLIIFDDYSHKNIEHVDTYGFYKETDCFYFIKNGYRCFIPKDHILFFGRETDWNEGEME